MFAELALSEEGHNVCHVLIIEDMALIALQIRYALEDAGATSFAFAHDETEAVEQARLRRPAFITSDVSLDPGDGPTAVAQILEEHGDIPFIFITSNPQSCVGCPPDRVHEKPLNEAALSQAFQELAAF